MSNDVVELKRDFVAPPEGWRTVPFSALADYVNGRAFKPEDWGTVGLPIIRIAQITNPDAATNFYDGEVNPRNLIDSDDLIFSWSATLAVMRWTKGPAVLNQHLFKVTPTKGIDRDWLQFRLEASIPDLADEAHGTTMKHIRKGTLSSKSTLVPPLGEQRRIAEVLRSVDDAIAAADLVAQQWAATFETLLEVAFAEGEPASLADICSLIYRYPGFYGFDQLEAGVPVIRGEHLRNGRISRDWTDFYFVDPAFSARFPKTVLKLDDVVMSVRGTVGTTAVVDEAHVGSQISPNLIRLVADPTKIVPPLLYYAVQSAVAHMRRTIVNAQALPAINAGDLKQVEIALPSLADQPALLAELNGAATARADAVSAVQQARQTKAVVMSDLLSGRVRVPA